MANDCSRGRHAAPLMFLLASEASEWQTVVTGGVVRPLVVKASGNNIPKMAGCVLLLSASKASGIVWWRNARPAAVALPRWQGACCFPSAGEASERQTVVAGGVMRPLAVKACGGGMPATGECLMI